MRGKYSGALKRCAPYHLFLAGGLKALGIFLFRFLRQSLNICTSKSQGSMFSKRISPVNSPQFPSIYQSIQMRITYSQYLSCILTGYDFFLLAQSVTSYLMLLPYFDNIIQSFPFFRQHH